MDRARTSVRLVIAWACMGAMWGMPGCRSQERVPSGTEIGSVADDEAAAVPKGTRYGGGFLPPIRRADLVLSIEVPASEQFVLGGDASASYFVEVENLGTTVLGIMGRRGLQRIAIGRAEPGDRVAYRFAATDYLVVTNRSAADGARVKVRIWGDIGGNIRYERADVVGEGE